MESHGEQQIGTQDGAAHGGFADRGVGAHPRRLHQASGAGHYRGFLDTSSARAQRIRRRRLTADRDDDLFVAALDDVIFLLDTSGEAPVDVHLQDVDGGIDVEFTMVDASALPQVGAVPKAVSLNELRLSDGQHGWRCSVTLDV